MPAASKKAFTLVELLIVVTIMAVLMAGTYIPYARFSLAAKVRFWPIAPAATAVPSSGR